MPMVTTMARKASTIAYHKNPQQTIHTARDALHREGPYLTQPTMGLPG